MHSPFVYDLVTKCFYDKRHYVEYDVMNAYREKLLKDSKCIEVKDFGAGSRVFKGSKRRIKSIAKHVGIPKKEQQLLFRLVKYFHPGTMLELGTSLGLGTVAMAMGHPDAKLISLEGCPETAKTARAYLNELPIAPDVINTEFQAFLDLDKTSFDLVYIDGHHEKEATLKYFNTLLDKVHNDSLLIFDDIHWSQGMTEAWEEIIQHPEVTVSIDVYDWGLVFFRKEQKKQHFRIRL